MDIERLHAFLLVAKKQSFSQAAEQLHITQPGLSIQIKALENLYNAKLFQRKGGLTRLTKAGEALKVYAQRLLNILEESKETVHEISNKGSRTLSVGGGSTSGPYVLARVLGAFKRVHPELEIVMKIGRYSDLLRMLAESEVDLCLTRLPWSAPTYELIVEPLQEIRMLAVASPLSPIARKTRLNLSEIAQENFILEPKGSIGRDLVDFFCIPKNIHLKVSMEFGSLEAIKAVVKENFGISILNELSIRDDVMAGNLKILRLKGLDISFPLCLLYLEGKKLSSPAEQFVQFLRHVKEKRSIAM